MQYTCSAAAAKAQATYNTSHLQLENISLGFAGTDSIRCPRGCARESPRAGRRTRPPGDTSGSRKLLNLEGDRARVCVHYSKVRVYGLRGKRGWPVLKLATPSACMFAPFHASSLMPPKFPGRAGALKTLNDHL